VWHCNWCKADFDEPDWERADPRYFARSAGHNVCPCCGDDGVVELRKCSKCAQPIYPDEPVYDGKCPDCFKAWVDKLLEDSPRTVAEALDVCVEVA